MPLYQEVNLTGGMDTALTSTAASVPAFPIMILVFIYLTIFIGGTSSQKRKGGNADVPMWAVLSGLATTMVTLVMGLGAGLVSLGTTSIVIAITIMSGFWYFMSRGRYEQ